MSDNIPTACEVPTPEAIVTVLGEAVAVKLFLSFGGSTVYVSGRPRPSSRLVREIGSNAVAALARTFGVGQISVPLGNAISARHLAAQQVPRAEIARRLRVARESVRTYLSEASA